MRFKLRVVDQKGVISNLFLVSFSIAEAELKASSLGYSTLSIQKDGSLSFDLFKAKPAFDILLFSQELVALLNAGLSLVAGIETLAEKSAEKSTQAILQNILVSLREGQTFSSTIANQPNVFPNLFVAMVKSSEKTGDLKQSIQRYVIYRSQLELVRNKLITASIYPVLLLAVGAIVSLFLLGYVVPKFSSIYGNVGSNIPFLSRILMQWGNLLHDQMRYVLGVSFIAISLIIFLVSRKAVITKLNAWLWSIPSLGEKLRLYQLARFYRTLGMLLQGGVPLVTALEMGSDLLGEGLSAKLQQAILRVKEGLPLSTALEEFGLSTGVSKRMMAVGEQTGNMGEMLENTASFYDHEIARWVDWMTRLIEPVLMMIIGLMIGGIVILMYLPIFELADSIQ